MITTSLTTAALLVLVVLVVLQGLFIVCLRITRRLHKRQTEQRVAPVRGLLLELVCAEDDEPSQALKPLTELDERTWTALEPTVAAMLGKVTGNAQTALIRLYEQHGATAAAVADLGRRSAVRRGRAAEVVGQLRHRPAAPALCRLLRDRDPRVRVVAARALSRIGEPSVVPQLLDCLRGQRTVPPAVVARALTSFGPEAMPAIAAGVHHPEPLVRAVVIEVLGVKAELAEAAQIVRALNEDPDPEVRLRAARALGKLGMPSGLEPLLAAVSPAQPAHLRRVAAGALGDLGAVAATARLGELLSDHDSHVATAAAQSLLQLGQAGGAVLRTAAAGCSGAGAAAQARAALAESAVAGLSRAQRAEPAP